MQTERKSWPAIRKQLRAGARTERSLLNIAISAFTGLQCEVVRVQGQIERTSDREEIKALQDKMGACLDLLADKAGPFLQQMAQIVTQAPGAEKTFENAYAPESMEKVARLEALLDARIAKILARLVARGQGGGAARG